MSEREKNEHYVNRQELMKELKKYKKDKVISEELGVMFLKIASKLATKKNFSGYSYKDEFISDAVYRMVTQIDKIDLNHPKCNPFAYLTQICKFKMIAKISAEKRYQEIKESLKSDYIDNFESSEQVYLKKETDDLSEFLKEMGTDESKLED